MKSALTLFLLLLVEWKFLPHELRFGRQCAWWGMNFIRIWKFQFWKSDGSPQFAVYIYIYAWVFCRDYSFWLIIPIDGRELAIERCRYDSFSLVCISLDGWIERRISPYVFTHFSFYFGSAGGRHICFPGPGFCFLYLFCSFHWDSLHAAH